jgi:hypothetical protein
MSVLHPRPGPHPVHTVHRVCAALLGAFLIVFAVIGLSHRLPFAGTKGVSVLGLSSNGLLAAVSLVVGLVLLGSAIRSGHIASTISLVLGALFLLSGVVNSVLLGTTLNVFAFTVSNVVFSLLVGAVLLITGGYGRISGGLPVSSPYHRDAVELEPWQEVTEPSETLHELAEAERADALHHATPEQLRRLEVVHQYRSTPDRLRAWRESAQQ